MAANDLILGVDDVSLRAVLDAVADPIFVFDREGRIAYANAAASLAPGCAELTVAPSFDAERRAVLAAGKAMTQQLTTPSRRTYEYTLSPAGNGAVVGLIRDITERAGAERRLRESEERSRRDAMRRIEGLARASKAFAEAGVDLDTAFGVVTRTIAELMSDGCALLLLSDSGTELRCVASHHPDPGVLELLRGMLVRPYRLDEGLPGLVFQSAEPLLMARFDPAGIPRGARPETFRYFSEAKPHSLLLVPLRVRRRVIGTLSIQRERPGPAYDQDDVSFLQELADRAALAIDNALLHREMRKQVSIAERAREVAEQAERRTAFLAEASVELASSLDYERTLQRVAELAIPRMADIAGVYLVEPDGAIRQIAIGAGDPAKVALSWELHAHNPLRLEQERTLPRAIRTGQPEVIAELPETAREAWSTTSRAEAIVRALGICSYMTVPFKVRGRVRGAIAFSAAESGRRFGPTDLGLAEELARRAGVSIENAELYREAQLALQARDDFLSIASHELKTPLTSLKLHVDSLIRQQRREPSGGQGLELKLEGAHRQVERLTKLIHTLLDISRIRAGRLDLELEEVDVSGLAREVAGRFEDELSAAGSRLSIEAPEQVVGQFDRMRLDQVLTNLLSNAIKYGRGQPIELSIARVGERAVVRVRDRGLGIASADQGQLFERFSRGVAGHQYGGFGLGLWIVRQIVEALGGRVRVESALGLGSEFVVELPLEQ